MGNAKDYIGLMRQNTLRRVYMVGFVGQRLSSVLAELEVVPMCLVIDTDTEATANQWWTSEGPLVNPHVFRVVIGSQ